MRAVSRVMRNDGSAISSHMRDCCSTVSFIELFVGANFGRLHTTDKSNRARRRLSFLTDN